MHLPPAEGQRCEARLRGRLRLSLQASNGSTYQSGCLLEVCPNTAAKGSSRHTCRRQMGSGVRRACAAGCA